MHDIPHDGGYYSLLSSFGLQLFLWPRGKGCPLNFQEGCLDFQYLFRRRNHRHTFRLRPLCDKYGERILMGCLLMQVVQSEPTVQRVLRFQRMACNGTDGSQDSLCWKIINGSEFKK